MRTFLLLVSVLVNFVVFAQFPFETGEATQITNADDNCKNPATIRFPDEEKVIIFYQKSLGDSSRQQIWAKDLLNSGEEILIYANDSLDFLSPFPTRMQVWNEPDTLLLFFTVYDNEKYYVKYAGFDSDLNTGEVHTFFSSTNNPDFFLNNSQKFCSWIDNGEVKTSRVLYDGAGVAFDSVITHDSGNCSEARVVSPLQYWSSYGVLVYLKDTKLFGKKYYNGEWESFAEELADGVSYLYANFMESFSYEIYGSKIALIENDTAKKIDDEYYLVKYPISYLTPSGEEDFNISYPATMPSWTIVGKHNYFYFYAGVTGSIGYPQVFLQVDDLPAIPTIISNDEFEKGKIYFFTGLDVGSGGLTHIEVVWEEFINGNTVLFYNDVLFDWPTRVEENGSQSFDLSITPNPVNNTATINYDNPGGEEVAIEIFDMEGKSVFQKNSVPKGQNNSMMLRLDALKPGVYFLKVSQQGKQSCVRFVKN